MLPESSLQISAPAGSPANGGSCTVTVILSVPVHELPAERSVTTTEYVVVTVGLTVLELPVWPLDHR